MQIHPYLYFGGRCEEALEFYKSALGAEITALMRFKEMPDPQPGMIRPGTEEKIMHGVFKVAGAEVFASDGHCSGAPSFSGFGLSATAPTSGEAETMFAALSEGGEVQMPMSATFFAAKFGMVVDKFGVTWMVLASPRPEQ